ncbi:MAG TPA: aminotransferase class I/II-fold pyridoxal phosphate-dependent enzyme [Pyrinomonadaceae bacterium]|nr:aminotransferase class I/II-fold pyridoxal phosphate-dependent enzyme [Pyrinomonadaceae bacterium]
MKEFQPPAFLRGVEKSVIRKISDRAGPECISLGLGEPDLPTPQVIRRAAVRVITGEQNGYTLQAGLPALREHVAADYPHLNLSREEVIITAGSQEALYLALMSLVEAGDEVLIPNPGFVAYATITRMAGGTPVLFPLPAKEKFGFNCDEFEKSISPRTKVVFCTSPSNPTGRTLSSDDLRKLAQVVAHKAPDAFIISDEIYRELYYTDERPASISEFYPRTIVISGLSKSMSMTGWRLGWICGEKNFINSALVLHGYVTTCASTISQKAALAAWTSEAQSVVNEHRRIFRDRRDHLLPLIRDAAGLGCVTPDGAFYTMVDVSSYGPSMGVAEAMLAAGVVTVPGSAFGSESEGFLRVSFCADLPLLTEGVKRMRAGLDVLGR